LIGVKKAGPKSCSNRGIKMIRRAWIFAVP
jgi:hypothetical protein